jgi:RNA polymerase sigma-70 factor, ECF subfamily
MTLRSSDVVAIEQEIPHLRRFARSRVGNPDLADDLVQGCLERAVENFSSFTRGTNLRAWLLTILRNHQISEYRKASRRPECVCIDEVNYLEAQGPTQDKVLEAKQFLSLFDKLSDSDQEILLLVGAEGLKYEEAADVVGIPVGTVRSRVFRARERLQALAAKMAAGQETGGERKRRSVASDVYHPHYA